MRQALVVLATVLGGAPGRVDWAIDIPARGTPAADANSVFFPSADHDVVHTSASGTVVWRRTIGEHGADVSGTTLTLTPDLVVAGEYDGVALDRRDGALRWRCRLKRLPSATPGKPGQPAR
jgi:outer membrane protein assembly factor BamB